MSLVRFMELPEGTRLLDVCGQGRRYAGGPCECGLFSAAVMHSSKADLHEDAA